MTAVDARFAGGTIFVEGAELYDKSMVVVRIPGLNDLALFPHEADALAEALRGRGELTEEVYNRREVADLALLAVDADTRTPSHILVGVDELDQSGALALATRLIELAGQLPEPRRIFRRALEVDQRFAEVDN